jgi:hypothetical protein
MEPGIAALPMPIIHFRHKKARIFHPGLWQ